jgi:GAF domain-containing protein
VSRILSYFEEKSLQKFVLNPISLLILIFAGLLFIARRGYIKVASLVLLTSTWVMMLLQARSSTGIYDTAFIANSIIILLTGLLLDFRFSIVFTFLAMITGWGLAYLQSNAGITALPDTPFNVARDYTIIFLLLMVISYLTISGLRSAVARAQQNAIQLSISNTQLRQLQSDLEKRVKDRTLELEERIVASQQQARLLEIISDISRSFAAVQDVEKLLQAITGLLEEHFDFYHTGIYLLNENREQAVLRAASSSGGKLLLERGHKFDVQPNTLVGFVASRAKTRVSSNSERDPLFKLNPALPDTKSEVAMPLFAGNQIIGVLDIQSSQENAFSAEYVNALITLSNQVAIAIQNASLFGETRTALAEAERVYNLFVVGGWQKVAREAENSGYKYSSSGLVPVNSSDNNPAPNTDASEGGVMIPIKLRDQTIGVLNIKSTEASRDWDEDELALIQAAADRAGLALENARLLEETSNRAERERTVSQITSKIRSTNDPNEMINIALSELKQALHINNVRIVPYTPPQSQEKS